jgi:nanoRNase/pAp phosphatase (c-di-AMP/oligoRNAs hydrolase)
MVEVIGAFNGGGEADFDAFAAAVAARSCLRSCDLISNAAPYITD